jgi:hypothetical protein
MRAILANIVSRVGFRLGYALGGTRFALAFETGSSVYDRETTIDFGRWIEQAEEAEF